MRAYALAAFAVVLGCLSAGAPDALALPILTVEDAAELAETLSEAEARQGVCYGWDVSITGSTFDGDEIGSSRGGRGVRLPRDLCPKYAILTGRIRYTPESSESEDSAAVAVVTNLPIAFSPERVGLRTKDLLENRDDATLIAMVEALPLVVAEDAGVPFVAFEPRAEPLSGDGPTNTPGSDWWRNYWPLVVVALGIPMAVVGAWMWMRRDMTVKVRRRLSELNKEDEE